MTSDICFAVPGDLDTLTGGYIYDKRLIGELRRLGHNVHHIALPASFPDPTDHDMDASFARLAIASERPVIIDGLAFGALDRSRVASITSPIIALIHHPLALESGLSAARQQHLFETERANLACAEKIIVPSPHTARLLCADYGVPHDRIAIARPGTDRPATPSQPDDPPLILSVGIQLPRKGHDVLLRALAQIKDLRWHAVIAGTVLKPDYAAQLAGLHAQLGLQDRVSLAGQVSQDKLASLYGTATVFALATRFEGYGIVFDEALVNGLPIVSCATGAVPDTVPKDAGLLVAADDPDAFAQALRVVLTSSGKRTALRQAAQAAGAALPSWRDCAATVSGVLAQFEGPQDAK